MAQILKLTRSTAVAGSGRQPLLRSIAAVVDTVVDCIADGFGLECDTPRCHAHRRRCFGLQIEPLGPAGCLGPRQGSRHLKTNHRRWEQVEGVAGTGFAFLRSGRHCCHRRIDRSRMGPCDPSRGPILRLRPSGDAIHDGYWSYQ